MTVRQIAELAKLALTQEEEAGMQAEMKSILHFVEDMWKADIPMSNTTDEKLVNVLRADEVRPSLARETLLAMAPSCTDEYLTVPRTFD